MARNKTAAKYPGRYNVIQGSRKASFNRKEQAWRFIGKSWAPYVVLNRHGEIVDDFIPF